VALSVAHPQLLGFGGQLVENLRPGFIILALVGHQVIEADAAVLRRPED
jgi:hypothetical protein